MPWYSLCCELKSSDARFSLYVLPSSLFRRCAYFGEPAHPLRFSSPARCGGLELEFWKRISRSVRLSARVVTTMKDDSCWTTTSHCRRLPLLLSSFRDEANCTTSRSPSSSSRKILAIPFLCSLPCLIVLFTSPCSTPSLSFRLAFSRSLSSSGNGDVVLPFGSAVYVGLGFSVFAMLVREN